MTYDQALNYIHSLEKFGINPGLERITALCDAIGNPQDQLKFVHVAGTNGKGSTSTMLSEIMQAAGYKTGLFTSPYVIDFCERMQINGKMISHEELSAIISEIEPIISDLAEREIQPTEFEVITAAAFLYFRKNKCDIVVLEVGLGGRYDSTNIIKTPLASVITSISLDHMEVLGDTIEEIAAEKCGIIKQGGITVSYPKQTQEALTVIRETASRMDNWLCIPDVMNTEVLNESINGTQTIIIGLPVQVPFMGEHMVWNAAVAVETARALRQSGIKITEEHIAVGIARARIPARMEIIGKKPLVILDGGHNEGCARALEAVIRKHLKGRKIIAVCGMMADKDYDAYLQLVAPLFKKIIATEPKLSRALIAQTLAEAAGIYCKDVCVFEDSALAFRHAKEAAEADDVIIICGSFYLASELRNSIIDV